MSHSTAQGSPSAAPALKVSQILTQGVPEALKRCAEVLIGTQQLTRDDYTLTNPTPEETEK